MPNDAPTDIALDDRRENLSRFFARARDESLELAAPLSPEDCQIQSMAEASPTKWHLAHTTWFFEAFVLQPFVAGHHPVHPAHGFLFNSYYDAIGPRHPRAARGLVSRPSLDDVLRYRRDVDAAVHAFIAKAGDDALDLIELGCHHEQQHQELILTDIRHALSQSILQPAYRAPAPRPGRAAEPLRWFAYGGGVREIGHGGDGFAFDNEGPRHRVFVADFRLAGRLATNGEWREFMRDGGYRTPRLWLSDGWNCVVERGWSAPLYWQEDGVFTLHGLQPIDDNEPVSCVSYYEADAFARWAGCRLPTEAEWEVAAAMAPPGGNLGGASLMPLAAATIGRAPAQLFGDAWEWTASPYVAYPGYRASPDAVGEYNGKFMANQMVLRGGSCVTPLGHVRASYRNFFPPATRWQFSGVRLAADGA